MSRSRAEVATLRSSNRSCIAMDVCLPGLDWIENAFEERNISAEVALWNITKENTTNFVRSVLLITENCEHKKL